MKTPSISAVVTSIQAPTVAMKELANKLRESGEELILVGDRKGPATYPIVNCRFFSIESQLKSKWQLASLLPEDHYSRKNLGYLEAMVSGAGCIYETDDDNAPLPHWAPRHPIVKAVQIDQLGWVNAYSCFSQERIWPRGFPLELLRSGRVAAAVADIVIKAVNAPIQQGLANGSPDVDAIWRLLFDRPFEFEASTSVSLAPGSWCPFNSQSTWWFPQAYPFMYLPSYCSFRMTDIWRSFIAQRCLWELGHGLVFHSPEVYQQRNPHDLMRDFADEVVGYRRNYEMAQRLEALPLRPGVAEQCHNLFACYEALVNAGFFPTAELELVQAWVVDVQRQPEPDVDSQIA